MNPIFFIRTKILKCSQVEVAEIIGRWPSTISRWESGEAHPTLDELRRLREETIARAGRWDEQWLFNPPKIVRAKKTMQARKNSRPKQPAAV